MSPSAAEIQDWIVQRVSDLTDVPRAEVHPCAYSLAVRVDLSPLVTSDNISLFTRVRRQRPQSTADVTEFN